MLCGSQSCYMQWKGDHHVAHIDQLVIAVDCYFNLYGVVEPHFNAVIKKPTLWSSDVFFSVDKLVFFMFLNICWTTIRFIFLCTWKCYMRKAYVFTNSVESYCTETANEVNVIIIVLRECSLESYLFTINLWFLKSEWGDRNLMWYQNLHRLECFIINFSNLVRINIIHNI